LAELGEFGAIAAIRRLLAEQTAPVPLLDVGDDAAAWQPTPGRLAVQTTDLLIEGVHFSLEWFSWYDVGWKAMAVNISDIAAMGAVPRAAVVSAGLKPDMAEDAWLDLYRGLIDCADTYGVRLIGGDTVISPTAAVVNVALHAESLDETGALLRRDAARSSDSLAVTGPLGASAAALTLLQGQRRNDGRPAQPVSDPGSGDSAAARRSVAPGTNLPAGPAAWRSGPSQRVSAGGASGVQSAGRAPSAGEGREARVTPPAVPRALLRRHVHPRPRVEDGQRLLRAGIRCAMDVSDGLMADLAKLCAASGLGAEVLAAAVPVDPDVRRALPDQALELALTGGEDYQLLVCGPEALLREQGLVVIGRVTASAGVHVINESGDEFPIHTAGYDAFLHQHHP